MQDTSCVPHAWSYTSVPCQESHFVQGGRIKLLFTLFGCPSRPWPQKAIDSKVSTDTSLKSRSKEQRMGTLSSAQAAGARFCPQPRGQSTPAAPCWVHLQPCGTAKEQKDFSEGTALIFHCWKTQFVTHCWFPAGHSLLLQHSARLGVSVLTVLWKVETLQRVELLQRQPWHFQVHHPFHILFWPKNWKKWDLCYPWQSTKSLQTK